jgi:hypothetical protein
MYLVGDFQLFSIDIHWLHWPETSTTSLIFGKKVTIVSLLENAKVSHFLDELRGCICLVLSA